MDPGRTDSAAPSRAPEPALADPALPDAPPPGAGEAELPDALRPRRPPERRAGFRPDIEGLRAVAILGVVLFHAGLSALPGGYVGVDVFFVVSGFLITGLLWRELETRGRLSFGGFYARRVRRLLPSSALVVVATTAASAAWLPPLQLPAVRADALASALYAANYRFAATSTNYLSAGGPPSPFLHYWSLGVEEQFYLVWPLLLAGVVLARRWLICRRSPTARWLAARAAARGTGPGGPVGPSRAAAMTALGLLAAVSFAASLWLTHADEPWAFYSLPTRAWELAAGGLVALGLPVLRRLPAAAAAAAGWAGLALVLAAMVRLDSATPFPGTAALVPVGGAVVLLAAGCARPAWGAGRLLGFAPLRWIGRVSYAWYLWHWPVLVLAPAAVGHPLSTADNLGLAAASLLLAAATTAWVERPIRFARPLVRRPRPSLAFGGAVTAVSVAAVLGIALLVPPVAGHGDAPTIALAGRRAVAGVAGAGGASGAGGAAGAAPGSGRLAGGRLPQTPAARRLAAAAALNTRVAAQVSRSAGVNQVPANVRPPLGAAAGDEAVPFFDGCFDSFLDAAVHPCDYGDTGARRSVFLFGDSHAMMWFPALDAIAAARHWRLVAMAKATCPPLLLPITSPDLGRTYTECEQWRQAVLARIRAEHPAVVVLGMARHYTAEYGFTGLGSAWDAGLAAMVRELSAIGPRVVVLGRVPLPLQLIPDCLSANLTDATACGMPRWEGLRVPGTTNGGVAGIARERAAAVGAGAAYVDTLPWFCTAARCPALVDNMIVYRDDNHITATYARWLAPALGADLLVATRGVF